MKKSLRLILALLLALSLFACGRSEPNIDNVDEADSAQQEDVEISLWLFPVGNWANPTSTASLLSDFQKDYPNVHVSVEHLSYENGDEKIEQAIQGGKAPDLVLEGPERLVANWGDKGLMADLSDLWDSDEAKAVYEPVRAACQHRNGAYYEFPLCMTAHCMAINYDLFKEAGALDCIDEETHTWTTEDFIKAVQLLKDYGQERVGALYCKNQSGDQGTRALVNNLYGGTFTDNAHTSYTIDSEENIKALQLLYDLEGIDFDGSIASADEVAMFCRKELAMVFCWNVAMEVQQTINNPDLDFEIFPMAFPTSSGQPKLQGGIWGLGIFDNGDDKRVEAAKAFIRYIAEHDAQYTKAVRISTYWPVRNIGNIYENDLLMTEYSVFTPYVGDYYQITSGWTDARTAWWQLLQKIGDGADIAKAVKGFPAPD